MRLVPLVLVVLLGSAAGVRADTVADRVDRIFREVPLVDGHNDLPGQYAERVKTDVAQIDLRQDQSKLTPALHTDLGRLRQSRVGGQFWSVFVPAVQAADAVRAVLEQIDVVHRLVELYPDTFDLASTADDVVRIHRSGKIASPIGVEGGHSIATSLAVLRQLYAAGARYTTLTKSDYNDWADSATADPIHGGLTPFGKAVVAEMNRLSMPVDLLHVAPKTMHDALDVTAAPVPAHRRAGAVLCALSDVVQALRLPIVGASNWRGVSTTAPQVSGWWAAAPRCASSAASRAPTPPLPGDRHQCRPGLDGIDNGTEPLPLFGGDAYGAENVEKSSSNLRATVREMEKSECCAAFGDEVSAHYAHFPRVEQERFDRTVAPWEREHYFERA